MARQDIDRVPVPFIHEDRELLEENVSSGPGGKTVQGSDFPGVQDPGHATGNSGTVKKEMMPLPAAVTDSYFKHDGVLAVLTIRDGTVQGEAGSPGADTRMLAASLTLLLKESDLFAEKLGTAPPPTLFLEFGDRLLLIRAQGNGQHMVVITRAGASLGPLNYQLGKDQVKEGLGV
jgi:predicted regulator of Ras-like GTPase activity (Roadblock/LC7/MglB family)